jgi:hypothetical protein
LPKGFTWENIILGIEEAGIAHKILMLIFWIYGNIDSVERLDAPLIQAFDT